MRVEVARNAGFCFGVTKAVQTAYGHTGESHVHTLGPLIHNEEVIKDLKDKGIDIVEEDKIEELTDKDTVIIRSHGVAKSVYDRLEKTGAKVLDSTCPFVLKIHRIVREASAAGKVVLIIGNEGHAEVEGIKGWCSGEYHVIGSIEAAETFEYAESDKEICVVSQTTFNYKTFKSIVEILGRKLYNIVVSNTICNATEVRQNEAKELAACCDAMIVVGGRSSSNTQKLYEICAGECSDTYFIQSAKDIDSDTLERLKKVEHIGITAGASTPKNIIQEVFDICQI